MSFAANWNNLRINFRVEMSPICWHINRNFMTYNHHINSWNDLPAWIILRWKGEKELRIFCTIAWLTITQLKPDFIFLGIFTLIDMWTQTFEISRKSIENFKHSKNSKIFQDCVQDTQESSENFYWNEKLENMWKWKSFLSKGSQTLHLLLLLLNHGFKSIIKHIFPTDIVRIWEEDTKRSNSHKNVNFHGRKKIQ